MFIDELYDTKERDKSSAQQENLRQQQLKIPQKAPC